MTYIVAELGSNHDGHLDQARALIRAAADAGADAVKFQCLQPFKREWMPELIEHAEEHGVQLFATPFDVDAVRELAALHVPYIKIASVELAYRELVEAVAETGIPIMLSTGMATFVEIGRAVEFWPVGAPVTLLQCTTRYPTPPDQVHLHAMVAMRERFNLPVGLSDHTSSIAIPAAAVALGATVIEKHLTLDRSLPGPDHPFALEPYEFARMVEGIREVERALGSPEKNGPMEGEMFELRGRRLRWEDS